MVRIVSHDHMHAAPLVGHLAEELTLTLTLILTLTLTLTLTTHLSEELPRDGERPERHSLLRDPPRHLGRQSTCTCTVIRA